MSKGSKQRPTDYEKYAANYDRIFRKPKTWAQIVEENGGVAPDIPDHVLEEIEQNVVRINRDIEERKRKEKLDSGLI